MANEPMKTEPQAVMMANAKPMAAIDEKVWDAVAQEHRTITQDMIDIFIRCQNDFVLAEHVRAQALYFILKSRAFLVGGYTRFEDYAKAEFNLPARTAFLMVSRAEKRLLLQQSAQANGHDGEAVMNAVANLNVHVRAAIYRMTPDDFSTALDEQTWVAPDGRELAPSEVVNELAVDLMSENKRLKKEKRDAAEVVDEQQKMIARLESDMNAGQEAIIGSLTVEKKKLEEELRAVKEKDAQAHRSKERIEQLRKELAEIYRVLDGLIPRTEKEFEARGDDPIMHSAAAICHEFGPKFLNLARYHSHLFAAAVPESEI